MSNVKIIRTARRQRDNAHIRAHAYKNTMEAALVLKESACREAKEYRRHSERMIYKFIKERRKFIAACIVAGIAIAVAVVK